MKKQQFLFVPMVWALLLIGCQEKTLDVATAEKMVREINVKFQQQPYETLEQNGSSDYVFINGEGGFVGKEQMLQIAKGTKIAKWDLDKLKVLVLDNVLVATGINNHSVGGDDGKASTFHVAFTYTYQVKNGELEVVTMQHTHVQ